MHPFLAEHLVQLTNELRAMLNDWDFLGVYDDASNVDEYDCMIEPLVHRLDRGDRVAEIAKYLGSELPGHFGLGTLPDDIDGVAARLVVWHDAWWQRAVGWDG